MSAPILIDGIGQVSTFDSIDKDETDFPQIGEAFAATGAEIQGAVANGTARLMRCREIVDFGTEWIRQNRPGAAD